jgi:hypothetical protein
MRRLERHRPLQLLQRAGCQPVIEGPVAFIEQQDGEVISRRGVIRVGGNLGFESLSRPSVLVQRQTGLVLPLIVREIIGRTSSFAERTK